MKKLFLILAATAVCTAFANSVSAQTDVDVILPDYVFSFAQNYPSVIADGGFVVLTWSYSNTGDSYPGKLARDMVNYALSQPNVSSFVRLDSFVLQYSDGLGYSEGYVKLQIMPSVAVGQANLHFVYQSKTIRNYY